MIKTAVIIAGGEGSRLKPLTDGLPKAMAPLRGRPMLYWIAQWLKANGIEHLVLGVAYLKEKVIEFMEQEDGCGLRVDYSEHTVDGGTAQGFGLAIGRHVRDRTFLAMNCDEITNLSISRMAAVHAERRPLVTMALAPFHCRFSIVDTNSAGMVSGFRYGHLLHDVLVSIGIYMFDRSIMEHIPPTGSIEDLVFAKLAGQNRIAAHPLTDGEEWISVNDVKDLRVAEAKLAKFPVGCVPPSRTSDIQKGRRE